MQRHIILFLISASGLLANLPTTTVWETRPSVGSDSNGGCFDSSASGTDFTQQNGAQFSATDLVLVTNNTVTSVSHSFASTDVGNCINISAGSGFGTGFYKIISVTAGTATLDRNAGNAPLTGGTWAEGGALANPPTAIAGAANGVGGSGSWPAGQTFWLKATGTFTQTGGTIKIQGGGDPSIPYPITFAGYTSTRGDNGIFMWTTASGSDLFQFGFNGGSNLLMQNIAFSTTAGSPGNAIGMQGSTANLHRYSNISFTGFSVGINGNAGGQTMSSLLVDNCEFSGGGYGIILGQNNAYLTVLNSYIHDGSQDGIFTNTLATFVANTVIYNMGGRGIVNASGTVDNSANMTTLVGVDVVSNGGNGYEQQGNEQAFFSAMNCLFISNGGFGIRTGINSPAPISGSRTNGYFGNTNGSYSGYTAAPGDVTLSGNPFVAPGTNFALNSGAGAAAKGTGSPGVTAFPSGATMGTGFADIGALQHQAGGGGSATVGFPIIQ